MRPPSRMLIRGTAVVLALVATVAACGDDDDEPAATGAPATEVPTTEDEPTTTAAAAGGGEVTITGVDYAFEDVPDEVLAGSKLGFHNASDIEMHELVVFRLPDTETRSIDELVTLPEEEFGALLAGPPVAVLLQAPGSSETIPAVGDGTLPEPGRYALLCFIPTGADPQAYMDAATAGGDGPPEVEGGPPHFTQGMFAELTVT